MNCKKKNATQYIYIYIFFKCFTINFFFFKWTIYIFYLIILLQDFLKSSKNIRMTINNI